MFVVPFLKKNFMYIKYGCHVQVATLSDSLFKVMPAQQTGRYFNKISGI
jgi:hypothetical protein